MMLGNLVFAFNLSKILRSIDPYSNASIYNSFLLSIKGTTSFIES